MSELASAVSLSLIKINVRARVHAEEAGSDITQRSGNSWRQRTNDVIKISSRLRLQVCVCGAVRCRFPIWEERVSNPIGVVLCRDTATRGQSTYKYSTGLVTSPGRIAAKLRQVQIGQTPKTSRLNWVRNKLPLSYFIGRAIKYC